MKSFARKMKSGKLITLINCVSHLNTEGACVPTENKNVCLKILGSSDSLRFPMAYTEEKKNIIKYIALIKFKLKQHTESERKTLEREQMPDLNKFHFFNSLFLFECSRGRKLIFHARNCRTAKKTLFHDLMIKSLKSSN